MNDLWTKLSQAGGALKGLAIILTFVGAVAILFNDVNTLNKYSGTHYRNIQTLQESQIKNDFRIDNLEKKSDKTDAQIVKLGDSINSLNIAITELTVTIREQGNKRG
ncbi:hypothetical protein ACLHZU_03680 [Aeromonas salmonicida]|uniref:hypothetical protein n=1 Tax=Aeromonas salmonicida TaxID=645 RepID=UPI003D06A337